MGLGVSNIKKAHLVADPAPGGAVRGPGPGPHVAEALPGHGGHAAEVRLRDAQVQVRVVYNQCRQDWPFFSNSLSIIFCSIDLLTPVEDAVLPQLGLIKVPRPLVGLGLDPASLHLGLGLDLRLDMAAGGSGGHGAVLLGLLKNQQVCSSGMKLCVLKCSVECRNSGSE